MLVAGWPGGRLGNFEMLSATAAEPVSDARDAYVIADQARMRRDLRPTCPGDEAALELKLLTGRRAGSDGRGRLREEAHPQVASAAAGQRVADEHGRARAQDAPQLVGSSAQVCDVVDHRAASQATSTLLSNTGSASARPWRTSTPSPAGMSAGIASAGSTATTSTPNQTRNAATKPPVPAPTSSSVIPGCGSAWRATVFRHASRLSRGTRDPGTGVEVLGDGARARIRPGNTVTRANATLARDGRLLGGSGRRAIACTVGGFAAHGAFA